MTSYEAPEPGDIVLVRFPFSEVASTKQRPALLLNWIGKPKSLQLAIVAMITSRVDPPHIAGDFMLTSWQTEGLLHASKLRLAKIATVDAKLIKRRLGTVSEADRVEIRTRFRELFAPWT